MKWKKIEGYDYYVSNTGSVKRNNKILKGTERNGYPSIGLYKKSRYKFEYVHRLVAKLFIPNPKNKEFVNHKDGNRKNNNVKNIEWCTRKENEQHAFRVLGKKSGRLGKKSDNVWLKKSLIARKKGIEVVFKSRKDFAVKNKCDQSSVSRALKGDRKTINGWKLFDLEEDSMPSEETFSNLH